MCVCADARHLPTFQHRPHRPHRPATHSHIPNICPLDACRHHHHQSITCPRSAAGQLGGRGCREASGKRPSLSGKRPSRPSLARPLAVVEARSSTKEGGRRGRERVSERVSERVGGAVKLSSAQLSVTRRLPFGRPSPSDARALTPLTGIRRHRYDWDPSTGPSTGIATTGTHPLASLRLGSAGAACCSRVLLEGAARGCCSRVLLEAQAELLAA